MKKDYIPVSQDLSSADEVAFLEKYWTQLLGKGSFEDFARSSVERRDEFKVASKYITNLLPHSRILDAGCGAGEWVIYFALSKFEAIGLDLSKKIVEGLAQRFPEHSNRFLVGDIRNTKFEDNYFDALFSWGVFEHFENGLGACFREANRIIKKGGYLFVSVPFQNYRHMYKDMHHLWRWDKDFDRERGYAGKMRFYQYRLTKPELEREFEIHGFKTLGVYAINKWHGLARFVKDLGITPRLKLNKITKFILYPFVPRKFIAHSILGIGIKR